MRLRSLFGRFLIPLALLALAAATPSAAQPAIDGYLVATAACPAPPAIRKPGNPGDVRLEVDHAYRLIAQNKIPPTHYWIAVPGASPERRWVKVDCGRRVAAAKGTKGTSEEPSADAGEPKALPAADAPSTRNLLAVSWQPTFCETRPEKAECASQTAERYDASNFALHGVWPQPRGKEYCGVSEADRKLDRRSDGWPQLPGLEIAPPIRTALDRVMPGAQSALDRHEWTRHGTCYGESADDYFADSIKLVEAINASPVRTLFAGRIGQKVTLEEVRAAFDQGFGKGAGQRIRLSCPRDGERRLIGEITVGLAGAIGPDSDVGALILAADATDGGCDEGIVDPVGQQ